MAQTRMTEKELFDKGINMINDGCNAEEIAKATHIPACVLETINCMTDSRTAFIMAFFGTRARRGGYKNVCLFTIEDFDYDMYSKDYKKERSPRRLSEETRKAKFEAKLEKLKKQYGIELKDIEWKDVAKT